MCAANTVQQGRQGGKPQPSFLFRQQRTQADSPQTTPDASRGGVKQPDSPGGSGQPGVNRTSGQGLFLCGSPPPGSPALLIYCMFYLHGDVS